jgi:hypothetical protein
VDSLTDFRGYTDLVEKHIEHTEKWIKSVVIDFNFCPFAAKAMLKGSIRYVVLEQATIEEVLACLASELKYLDVHEDIETSFIILPDSFVAFEDYLELVELSENAAFSLGKEGVYQIASFHPEYTFEGVAADDASNYTNRSPYPMLHLLREDSITKALAHFPNPDAIPENNIAFTREKGLKFMQMMRAACM